MPEPLLTIGVLAGYSALYAAARGGSAVSEEASMVQRTVIAVVESTERSRALFGGKADALSQISLLTAECAEAGWDGGEADPVHASAAKSAGDFVRALPNDLPLPEFAAEPDGSISLDWIVSRHRLFSLSVGRSGRLAYAWLDGADKGHAVARFDGVKIPGRVLEGIRAIVTYGGTTLRAA